MKLYGVIDFKHVKSKELRCYASNVEDKILARINGEAGNNSLYKCR